MNWYKQALFFEELKAFGRTYPIYNNPSLKEWRECMSTAGEARILVFEDGNVLAWDSGIFTHDNIIKYLQSSKMMPSGKYYEAYAYLDGRQLLIQPGDKAPFKGKRPATEINDLVRKKFPHFQPAESLNDRFSYVPRDPNEEDDEE